MSFVPYLHRVVAREHLSEADAKTVMELVLTGEVSTSLLAAFLVALQMKGETPGELVGFARAMRDKAVKVDARANGAPLLDTCGTGGDGACTFNISTIAAFVIAGAGLKVAKHGNRSISSQCGSADILEALGVNIAIPPEQMAAAIREIGIGFLFAPAIHPAMKHAQAARIELKMRTAFNLLGPLTNPAGADVQVVGAPSVRVAELLAESLAALGLRRGFVVHGLDGLDEITTTGETLVFEIARSAITQRTVTPTDFGVAVAHAADLKGGDRETNSRLGRAVLEGRPGPQRDVVLVNAAAALVAAGRSGDFREGVEIAAASIDTGAAVRKLDELIRYTRASRTSA
jgi:anthranilate phosphoribosyltransferase